MSRKCLAAFTAAFAVALIVASVPTEAQGVRQRSLDAYTGSPLQRGLIRNMSLVDGPIRDWQRRSAIRHSSWSYPGYYGSVDPYLWNGYGHPYGRRLSRSAWVPLATGVLGYVLGRTTTPKQTEVRTIPVPMPIPEQETTSAQSEVESCTLVMLKNNSGANVLIGNIEDPRAFTMQTGAAFPVCAYLVNHAWKRIGDALVQATLVPSANGTVIIR